MIFGHDFKYRIPEMDYLLGVSADIGIHYGTGNESISSEDDYLIQIVNGKIGSTDIRILVSTYDLNKREEETV